MAFKRVNIVKDNNIEEFSSNICFFEKGSTDAFYMFINYNYLDKKIIFNLVFLSLDENKELEKTKTNISDKNCIKIFNAIDSNLVTAYNILCKTNEPSKVDQLIDEMNIILSRYLFLRNKEDFSIYTDLYNNLKENYHTAREYILNSFNYYGNIIKNKDEEVNNYIFRFFNVGQANCSALYKDNEDIPFAVFDFGCGNKKNTEQIKMLSSLDENGVFVISHFHSDHINMSKYISDKGYKRLFILPELSEYRTTNAIGNLFENLYLNKSPVICIKNDSLSSYLEYENIKICQGKTSKMSKYQSSLMNTRCLVSVIYNKKDKAIIQGDAFQEEYAIYEEDNVFKFGTVSHHGASYGGAAPLIIQFGLLFVKNPCHVKYKHPQKNSLKIYDNTFRFESKNQNDKIFLGASKADDVDTLKIKDKYCKDFILY